MLFINIIEHNSPVNKEQTINIYYSRDKLQNHYAKRKKPEVEDHILYYFIMKYTDKTDFYIEEADRYLSIAGDGDKD